MSQWTTTLTQSTTRPLFLKSEAPEAFKAFRVVTENGSGKRLRKVMTDNARELLMGEMRDICERDGIKLHTTVPYHPVLNGVAEHAIGVLTTAAHAMLHVPCYTMPAKGG